MSIKNHESDTNCLLLVDTHVYVDGTKSEYNTADVRWRKDPDGKLVFSINGGEDDFEPDEVKQYISFIALALERGLAATDPPRNYYPSIGSDYGSDDEGYSEDEGDDDGCVW